MTDPTYTIKYPPRSIVYDLDNAKKGILERVVIKTFQVNVGKFTKGQPVILYTDTLNRLWIEDYLCPESEAVALSIAYYNKILAETEELED